MSKPAMNSCNIHVYCFFKILAEEVRRVFCTCGPESLRIEEQLRPYWASCAIAGLSSWDSGCCHVCAFIHLLPSHNLQIFFFHVIYLFVYSYHRRDLKRRCAPPAPAHLTVIASPLFRPAAHVTVREEQRTVAPLQIKMSGSFLLHELCRKSWRLIKGKFHNKSMPGFVQRQRGRLRN